MGTQVHHATACYPQTNGLCKHFHRYLKMVLCAVLLDGNLVGRLPWVMPELHSAPYRETKAWMLHLPSWFSGNHSKFQGKFCQRVMALFRFLSRANFFRICSHSDSSPPWFLTVVCADEACYEPFFYSMMCPICLSNTILFTSLFRVLETGSKRFVVGCGRT